MIDLTPLEVRKKKGDFSRSFRGYEAELVDNFLDLVADRLEHLVRENMGMSERLARLEEQIAIFRERERALTDALVVAQEVRDEVKRQAVREAELLRREAENEAEQIRAAAVQTREREEDALRQIKARRRQIVQSYRSFLERELGELAVLADSLEMGEGEKPAGPRARKSGGKKAVVEAQPELEVPEVFETNGAGAAAETQASASDEVEAAAVPPEDPSPSADAAATPDEEPEWLTSILKEER